MYAVIFEVQPKAGCLDEYLEIAKRLRPELDRIEGFLTIDRLASRETAGRILSFQTWRDDAAVTRWREHGGHREAQAQGRRLFADYRLRVGEVIDPGPGNGAGDATPANSRIATVTEFEPGADLESGVLRLDPDGLLAQETFESLYTPGKRLLLASWRDEAAAAAGAARAGLDGARPGIRHLRIRVRRDYGPTDRREAPRRVAPRRVAPRGAAPDPVAPERSRPAEPAAAEKA
jgi:heme-degrading monooxygenase HmoA